MYKVHGTRLNVRYQPDTKAPMYTTDIGLGQSCALRKLFRYCYVSPNISMDFWIHNELYILGCWYHPNGRVHALNFTCLLTVLNSRTHFDFEGFFAKGFIKNYCIVQRRKLSSAFYNSLIKIKHILSFRQAECKNILFPLCV